MQEICGVAVSFLGALPEFSLVLAEVLRSVFLRLMFQDGLSLEVDCLGCKWNNDT